MPANKCALKKIKEIYHGKCRDVFTVEKAYSCRKENERRGYMKKTEELCISDFAGVYKELASVIGIPATIALHQVYNGQQLTLPRKLYSRDYIISQVKATEKGSNVKQIASEYGYTERRLRQILKESQT